MDVKHTKSPRPQSGAFLYGSTHLLVNNLDFCGVAKLLKPRCSGV